MIVDKKTRFIKPPKAVNYLSNKTLIPLLKLYKDSGVMPNELGECFLLLAKKLATAANFRGYTYVDDFIQDGVECCLKYAHNYDPEKGTNPFGYFTQIMKFSFINRIKQESHYQKVKRKAMEYDENGYPFMENIIENSLDKGDIEDEDEKIIPLDEIVPILAEISSGKKSKLSVATLF